MSIEKLPQTSSEKSPGSGQWSPIAKNPDAFKVLSQHPVNPELFGNEEAVLKDLRENHVKIEEVELFGRICEIAHIDLPPVSDFQGLKMDVLLIRGGIESLQQNVGLDNNASDKFSQFLKGVSEYMKSYGIDLGKNTNFEYVEDSINSQHNDILKYISRFVPWEMYTFLLNGGKVLQVAYGEGNYCIKDLDSININADCPLSLLSPDSGIKKSIIYPIPGSYYECIELQDWRGKSKADEIMQKMDELKNADLVLVYRGNEKYFVMNGELSQLVKFKYGGKIYSIVIEEGTEKDNLSEQDIEVLTDVLANCKCMTDGTVSKWTGIETQKIEDVSQDDGEMTEQQKEFLDVAKNIETYYMNKGIDTVYILSSYRSKEKYERKLLLEHGGFCQREDGTIYYINKEHDQDEEHYDDAKRFWERLFSKMNVKFIEEGQLERNSFDEYKFRYGKSEGALAIVDWHFVKACEDFEIGGGNVITFGGDSFGKGIPGGNFGGALAEKICKETFNSD